MKAIGLLAKKSPPARSRMTAVTTALKAVLQIRELALFALIIVICLTMTLATRYFMSAANFRALSIGLVPTAIIAVGMTVLLVSGGFDLSVGSVMALAGTVTALMLINGVPIWLAVILTLGLGICIGIGNGVLVTVVGINPLVATLGTMSVARGAALVLTEGHSVGNLPKEFGYIGGATWAGVPLMVIIMMVIVVIGDVGLRHTRYLRQVYYIGANEAAAKLSGILVSRVRIVAYTLTAFLAALAGLLLSSRLQAGTPTAGSGLELQVLAAAVIGGARLGGGAGTVFGAFLGVVFVGLVNNAMTMLRVSILWQMVVTGIILIIAVALDMLLRRVST
jgi:ribose transport system permease protein